MQIDKTHNILVKLALETSLNDNKCTKYFDESF